MNNVYSFLQTKSFQLSIGRLMTHLLVFCCFLLSTALPVAVAEEAGERFEVFGGAPSERWIYGAEIYLWGADVGGKTFSGQDVDIKFDDLIKDLEIGLMGTLAASRDNWTIFGDFIYLDVDDEIKGTLNVLGTPVPAKADIELQAFVTTLGAGYRFLETDKTRLNILGGARYAWIKANLDVNIGFLGDKKSDSGNVWDGIVGLRGKTDLNEQWYLTYYADVGAGSSELTWQALGGINYKFKKLDAVVGYRYLYWDFDKGDMLTFDELDLSGPFAGVKFRF